MLTRNELKKLKSLQTRRGRRAEGLFLAEGVRLLEAALERRVLPRTLYFDPAERTARSTRLVEDLRANGVSCEELPSHQIEALADVETPQGIIAVFKYPETTLRRAYRAEDATILVCDGISDPGNLGTLIRSALAFGFELIVLTGDSADPFAPKVVRSTVGALFGARMAQCGVEELLSFVAEESFQLIGTSGQGEPDHKRLVEIARTGRLALAVGSEHEGLSPAILERSTLNWSIAHSEKVESLNAAVAGAIAMKEVFDARRAPER